MNADHPIAAAFKKAVEERKPAKLRELVAENPDLREALDEPWFAFGAPALVEVAHHRDREMMDTLLDLGADPNVKSDWEAGPYGVLDRLVDRKPPIDQELADHLIERGAILDLHAAAGLGRVEVVKRLLDEAPERVNEPGPDGATALHLALTVEVASLLLERGADIEQRCVDHASTPIMWSTNGRPEVTRYLLERGARPDLFLAAYLDDLALAERILEQEPEAIDVQVRYGKSHEHVGFGDKYVWALDFADRPVEVARRRGSQAVYAYLLERSPPNVQLVQAARSDDLAAIDVLVTENPDLLGSLLGDEAKQSLLGTLDAVRLLLRLGVDPNAREENGSTAAHDAAWNNDTERLEVLLEAGADLGIRDRNHSSSPLGWAHVAGHRALVERLAETGAIDIVDAAWLGRTERVREILSTDPTAALDREKAQASALRTAVYNGHEEIVRLLLEHGADPTAGHPETGKNALEIAVEEGHSTIAELLRR